MHKFKDPNVFGRYDIRGVVDDTLTERDVYAIGRAFGTILMRKPYGKDETRKGVVIGRDVRPSSRRFAYYELSDGIRDAGMDVTNVGECSTPYTYYAERYLGAKAGVMVTGSHLGIKYNGVKLTMDNQPFAGGLLSVLRDVAECEDYNFGNGRWYDSTCIFSYIDSMRRVNEGDDLLTVTWDAGNGVMADMLRSYLELNLHGEA